MSQCFKVMMSENNVAFRLERYDEVRAIAFDGHFSPSSVSKRLANFVGNYRHDAPPWRSHRSAAAADLESPICPAMSIPGMPSASSALTV
jgi:hypothetical protein